MDPTGTQAHRHADPGRQTDRQTYTHTHTTVCLHGPFMGTKKQHPSEETQALLGRLGEGSMAWISASRRPSEQPPRGPRLLGHQGELVCGQADAEAEGQGSSASNHL